MGLDQISALKELLSGKGGYFLAVIRAHLAFVKWILVGKSPKSPKPKAMKQMNGVYDGNVVFEFFAKGKKKFSEIIFLNHEDTKAQTNTK
jgi:hypothetical protein